MKRLIKRWSLDKTGRQNLKLTHPEITQPGPNEVLVRVQAVSMNFRDIANIEGKAEWEMI